MDDNDKFFTVTLNLAEVTNNPEKKNLIMLLDETKMTLVFEVMEWIRWIFSIENCFHLTHNDSVIHSTERIRILALLKHIDVKPCTAARNGDCCFSQLDKSVFSHLNFFQDWMNTRVPKILASNLSTINLKLNFEKGNKTCAQANEFSNSMNIDLESKTAGDKENNYFCLNQAAKKQIPTKTISPLTMNHCQQKNAVRDSNLKCNGINCEGCEEELCERGIKKINKRKKHLVLEINNSQSQEHDKGCYEARNQESEEPCLATEEKTRQTKKVKNIYCGRPFSLGETLNNLRNAVKESSEFFSKRDSAEGCSRSSPPDGEYAWGKNLNNANSPLYKEGNAKKRKRVRRSRSKKQKCEQANKPVVSGEKMMWNNDYDTAVKEIKSKHIRFNSSSDSSLSDLNESELNPCRVSTEGKKSSAESFQAVEVPQNENADGGNLCDKTSQNNFSLNQNSFQVVNKENSIELENREFAVDAVDSSFSNANDSNVKNADFNALLSLKNLFQSPVVIDRF